MKGWRLVLVAALLCAAAATACSRSERNAPGPERELVVFAAASLREAFEAMGEEFRGAHPDVTITFNFAGTQELRTQVEEGAGADVFASADERHMDALVTAGRARAPVRFAANEPVMVVARERAGGPAGLRSLADLPRAERLVIGGPDVPIGRYTLQILNKAAQELGSDFRARVEARVVSREHNVRQVLAKVSLGEADAGVVYRSDVARATGVTVVDIPAAFNVLALYPIAVVHGAPHPELARAWIELVLSPSGQGLLRRAGFTSPPAVASAP